MALRDETLGFIGCGMIGEAMIKGLLREGLVDPQRTYVVTGRERHVEMARAGHLPAGGDPGTVASRGRFRPRSGSQRRPADGASLERRDRVRNLESRDPIRAVDVPNGARARRSRHPAGAPVRRFGVGV